MLKVFNTITGYYFKKTCLSWWKLFYPKHCLEHHVSLLGIHLNHLVLSFQSLMKSYDATIQITSLQLYFHMVLLVSQHFAK